MRLIRAKWGITIFFLLLGLLTLGAYIKIGIEHQAQAGERYQLSQQSGQPEVPFPTPESKRCG